MSCNTCAEIRKAIKRRLLYITGKLKGAKSDQEKPPQNGADSKGRGGLENNFSGLPLETAPNLTRRKSPD